MPAQAWVTLIVGLVATAGVVSTLHQRSRADNRREWWVRFEWAMNATYSPDPLVRSDGWRIVRVLVVSDLATTTERTVITAMTMRLVGKSMGHEER